MNISVIEKLQEKFGDHFHTEPTFREQYCQAPTGITLSPPDGVVIVRNEQDIVDIVTFCSVEGLPMIPSGARTSIEGQINAPQGGICIDCSEMNAITDISIEDMTATIQPGVTREQLNEALRGTGLFFSVDPGANASIGGMAATRASGTNSVRYGTMATNVRAARLVMVDGSIANIGSRAVKSAMGLDLLSLAVGSEGTLGIFSELTVKLHPLPEVILSGFCAFDSVENAVRAVTDTLKSALPIARIELLNVSAVRACNAYSKLGLSEKPHLFVELHVNSLSMPGNIALFEEHVHRYGGEVQLSSHPEEREALWVARHDAWWAFHAFYEGCQGIPTDICVPLSCLSACISATETDIANTGLKAPLIGHVGDGNFHLLLMLREGEEETPVIQGFLSRLAERALSYGGTISGEHGVGQGKIKWMPVQHGAALHLMKAIKSALDPHNIMNPAKMY
ncbi:lactate dehydrogenase [Enterobacter hormaechei subsp. xiangfangensis]|uniref:FAD-binding oxidoreductase n=1 Tax=Enterobacter hormaechei TaxID=158836 RepID=UPI0007374FB9|nr:FAD-linked oxidase C-terminal domain-containing protein [Enterobacter hormaechei]KTQ54554.1 lactate dehydrogenase [Enterobacter hormaechei]KTQ59166.1 lactate dehydrogenase [Enterobacter hormaechei subsp. xiangfangensis]KTQ60327.1 lactate dehydrogenase [Enterobacter hormaechei]KTQ72025.1 lactate dehydrogenase [Enterobacter hormaechei subsp. xiangfangensis]KTQ78851.1 lactate dehydrogenase [Enterobacter hormaechei]